MQNNRRNFLFLLILIAGLIPVPVYLLETNMAIPEINTALLPSREPVPIEQQAQVIAGLFVKPVYMMLSLGIILALNGQKRPSIRALQLGQVAFLAGETFCAFNFTLFRHESVLSEYLHSYGMVLAIGFTSFALLEGWMVRFVRPTSLRSTNDAKNLLFFLIPSLAILCFIPLLSAPHPNSYSVTIYGFPYSYVRLEFYEFYEHKILPILALLSFAFSFAILLLDKNSISHFAKVLLCAGSGFLGFSFFRVVLNALFPDNLVWFEFWEEVTELMYVSAIGFTLWILRSAFLERTPTLEIFKRVL